MKINLKISIRVFCLLFLSHCLVKPVFSQQIVWANKNNLDKKTNFTKVVGQNKYGLFVLKHKNSTFRRYFILEHFDKKMNLLKSKTFKTPNAELEKIVVHSNGILVFTREYQKGHFHRLLCMQIDSGLNESQERTVFTNNPDWDISEIRIEYNSKRDLFLIWFLKDQNEKAELRYYLMNKQTELKKASFLLKERFSEIYVGDALIDDSGNLSMIYTQSEKFKSKSAADFNHYFFSCNLYNQKTSEWLINNDETFIGSYKLSYNPFSKQVEVFGLTGEKDEEDNKGYFHFEFNGQAFKIQNKVFHDFDRQLVGEIMGMKSEQKGENLNKFKIKKLIPKINGGCLVICERMFITTQSDIFYVNGIPQSSYAKIFNNDEVLLIDLDSNGLPNWTHVIYKNQSSINDGGYYNGIVIMVNETEVHILYNDKLSANADIIQVSYQYTGEHSKKILINNEQFYALVIPSEYNQVSKNSMVLPINQNRDFTYIKLLY